MYKIFRIFTMSLFFFLIVHCTLKIEDCMSQWQPDVRLTNATGNSYTSLNNAWCIASSGNVIHVVWWDWRDGNTEIYYKHSTDEGVSWGADTRLTNNTADSRYPSVAVSGSFVHVVWTDYRDGNYEMYYKRSTDAGVSWGADTRLTNNSSSSMHPSVAVSGSAVHVVWEDNRNGNWEIYYKHSTDAGISWGADTRLTNNTGWSELPSVAVYGSVVHVVWDDDRNINDEIYYKRSIDGGVSWGADIRLTNTSENSDFPSVAVSGSVVHVVWCEADGYPKYDIYYKRSTDSGVSWGADTCLANDSFAPQFPSIAVSGTLVHVVWEDSRDGNYEIYYKRSTDTGINWGVDTRLTNNTAYSWEPSVAVTGSAVHVVWRDERDGNGNFEIYYKRNPTGNTIGIKNINSEIPSSYSLQQNYPNPFNPITNVKFQIANTPLNPLFPIESGSSTRGEMISLKVFDITGKEVATLVNEQLAPGTYETSFSGSQLTSGIYFYKLTAGNFVETRKMILLK